jgi:carboxyl-terminal processing protease
LQIDNTPVANKTNDEIFKLLRQWQQSETHLFVLPFGQTESKELSVRRERIHYESVVGFFCDSDQRVFSLETHPKIGYIWITSFNESTAKEFGNALNRMMQSGAESFILDLRDNSGGDVWNCVQAAQMLMSPNDATGNVVATVRNRDGQERLRYRRFVLIEGTQRCTLPMVVLINGDTASASEILAAALQDHRRAIVVGTRSFGKGVIQGILTLPFQSGILQLTEAEYRRPNGAGLHRKNDADDADDWGVVPDRIIELAEAERSAVSQYRLLCSNVIATDRRAVLEQFRQQIAQRQDKDESEANRKPIEFTGDSPYYDSQLDAAIKILLEESQNRSTG